MVWWKAVSMTHTCVTLGSRARAASIPMIWAGLCKGAKSAILRNSATTLSSTITDLANLPPCTIRWPTALITLTSSITPCTLSVNVLMTKLIASLWSLQFWLMTYSGNPGRFWLSRVPSIPIRSTPPAHKLFFCSQS